MVMNYKKITLILILVVSMTPLVLSQVPSSDSLTMDQAVKIAMDNHPAILGAAQGIFSAAAKVEQNKGAFYPEISGLGSYERIGPVPTFELPGGPEEALAPANNYDFHVGLFQTVYDFGRRSTSVDLAETGQHAAADNVELVKSNLSYQTIQVFYSILFLQQNIAVKDDQIGALNQHLDITQKKVQTGTATNFDILTTQVRVATAQSQRSDLVNALHKQENMLRQLTGLSPDSPITLKGEFLPREISLNVDSLISQALSQLPEMRLSRTAEESATLQRQLASLGNRPSLGINLLGGFKNGYFPNLNTIKADWAGGAEIQAPIFNGFQTRSRVRQADAALHAAQEHTSDLQRQIVTNVTQAISDVQTSQEKIATSEPQVAQAEQAVTIANGRYNAGVATNLDLLDAETALADAKLIYLQALYQLVISQYALDKAVGRKVW